MIPLQLTPAPGYYPQNSVVLGATLTDTSVKRLLVSTSVKPALAKYIAYDSFGNPFIAVLSDGAGNVVFDGGFPKFYNNQWASKGGSTYASMANQFKYGINAWNWISDPKKLAAGNRKLLFLGDSTASYKIYGTDSSDFNTTFNAMCNIGGFTPTYYSTANANPIDLSYGYLDQFCGIVVMSSAYGQTADMLTAGTVANLLTLREQGTGMMIITDHNSTTNIYEKVNTFQRTANQLAEQFGARFYGNVDRSPVSVDYLIATYGEHPLWANMTGDFYAGGSEGIIQVTTFPEFRPGIDTVTLSGPGYRVANILAEYNDGTIEVSSYSYALNIPNPVSITGDFADTFLPSFDKPAFSVSLMDDKQPAGVMLLNGQVIGNFNMANPTPVVWQTPGKLSLRKGSNSLELRITSPVTYSLSYSKKRLTYGYTSDMPLAQHGKLEGAELGGRRSSYAELCNEALAVVNLTAKPTVVGSLKQLKTNFGEPL